MNKSGKDNIYSKFSEQNPNITDPISSLYIHIPFCTRKCGYCDYYSVNSGLADFTAFILGLKQELALTLADIEHNKCNLVKLKTLYIGGGTPSVLPPDVMTSISNLIKEEIGFDPEIEFTLEVNPEPLDTRTILAAIDSGVNRISLGYQAKQDFILDIIGRRHSFKDFLNMLEIVRRQQVENISCDLMFGLPEQQLSDVIESAEQLIELKIPHISFYSLILEPGTLFWKKFHEHPEFLPSDDAEREMYHKLIALFRQNDYQYYELSSCSKPGYRSRHNYNYWTTKPYLALGPSAHSYYNGIRKGNIRSLNKWLADPWQSAEREIVDSFQSMQEYAMLAFRMSEGFSPIKFKQRFGIEHPFAEELTRLLNKDLIYLDSTTKTFCLTEYGLDFANQVFIEFV